MTEFSDLPPDDQHATGETLLLRTMRKSAV
jgi:hypothetical protein